MAHDTTNKQNLKPLAIDLFCGLGGWTEGLLAEGYDVVGFDIERHIYGEHRYPAQLVLQDVRTIDGAQFKDASLIVASPPCQEFSYMAMPWRRAKQIAQALFARKLCGNGPPFPDGYTGSRSATDLTQLFDECFRIQREACAAAGKLIPLIIENVRGAQPWVGRSRWAYGSYHLWGDVPALMPMVTRRTAMKVGDVGWRRDNDIRPVGFNVMATRQIKEHDDSVKIGGSRGDDWFTHHNRPEFEDRATKNDGGSWFNIAHNTTSGTNNNPARGNGVDGVKSPGGGADGWFGRSHPSPMRRHSSKSSARKAASARIAKIPLPLARWIAKAYFPAQP